MKDLYGIILIRTGHTIQIYVEQADSPNNAVKGLAKRIGINPDTDSVAVHQLGEIDVVTGKDLSGILK